MQKQQNVFLSVCVLKHSMLPTNYCDGFSLSLALKAKNKPAVFSLGLATELYLHCCFTEAEPRTSQPLATISQQQTMQQRVFKNNTHSKDAFFFKQK